MHFRVILGFDNPNPLERISTPRFGRTGKEAGVGCVQLLFTLPRGFLLGVVAPLNLAETDHPATGSSFGGVQDSHYLLHMGQILPKIQVFGLCMPKHAGSSN